MGGPVHGKKQSRTMDARQQATSVGASLLSACAIGVIAWRWPDVFFNADSRSDCLVVLVCAACAILFAHHVLLLTAYYDADMLAKAGSRWGVVVRYPLRALGFATLLLGIVFGIASVMPFLGRGSHHHRLIGPVRGPDGGPNIGWWFCLFVATYGVVAFVLHGLGVRGRNKLERLLLTGDTRGGRRKRRRK